MSYHRGVYFPPNIFFLITYPYLPKNVHPRAIAKAMAIQT